MFVLVSQFPGKTMYIGAIPCGYFLLGYIANHIIVLFAVTSEDMFAPLIMI